MPRFATALDFFNRRKMNTIVVNASPDLDDDERALNIYRVYTIPVDARVEDVPDELGCDSAPMERYTFIDRDDTQGRNRQGTDAAISSWCALSEDADPGTHTDHTHFVYEARFPHLDDKHAYQERLKHVALLISRHVNSIVGYATQTRSCAMHVVGTRAAPLIRFFMEIPGDALLHIHD